MMAVIAGTGTGAVIDIRCRRIPNTVTLSMAVLGLCLAVVGASDVTLGSSALGLAFGFGLMMPGYVVGATGAGDVKLFAATGSVVGAGLVFWAFCYTAFAGGLLALAVALRRRRLAATVRLATRLLARPAEAKDAIESPVANNRFPYGPAIAIGSTVAVCLH